MEYTHFSCILQANPSYCITPTVLFDLINSAAPSVNHLICQTLREINISFFNQSISHPPHSAKVSSISHFTDQSPHSFAFSPTSHHNRMLIRRTVTSSLSIFTRPVTSSDSLFTHQSPRQSASSPMGAPVTSSEGSFHLICQSFLCN